MAPRDHARALLEGAVAELAHLTTVLDLNHIARNVVGLRGPADPGMLSTTVAVSGLVSKLLELHRTAANGDATTVTWHVDDVEYVVEKIGRVLETLLAQENGRAMLTREFERCGMLERTH